MSRHPIAASLTLGAVFLAAVAVTGCGDSASSSATQHGDQRERS